MSSRSTDTEPETSTETEIVFRRPVLKDGAAVHRFIHECGTLELNTQYLYFLLCSHFADTCVIAERGDELVGFLGGYRLPAQSDTFFVWQIGVSPAARGRGLAGRLMFEALSRPENRDVHYIEATVSPENRASAAIFRKMAGKLSTTSTTEPFLEPEDFSGSSHSAEILHRVGPFTLKGDA